MILKGNQRANGTELAIHLMKDENEHIEIMELRGFVGRDLMDAFHEVQTISRHTKCQKYLYALSLNPPANEHASQGDFLEAIERAEETLGLNDQPRAIVMHTKEGRTHCHAVWSRIHIETMRAIKLEFPKRKLNGLSYELFVENGWQVPAGFQPGQEADPMNYTFEEYQEAKRGNRQAKHFKQQIKNCWSQADGRKAFEAALERNGLFLAQGDRRGFVCIDYEGNSYSLSRWSGVKTKELCERLGEPDNYRSVNEMRAMIAERMTPKLKEYVAEVTEKAQADLKDFETQKSEMTQHHRQDRANLTELHEKRWQYESAERASRFSTGLKGIWHRITGKHRQIAQENELLAQRALQRDKFEQQELHDKQQRYRQQLQDHIQNARANYTEKLDALYAQLAEYAAMGPDPGQQQARLQQNKQAQERSLSQIAKLEFEQ
ncbi:MAG: relaxase/mobilization nuclease domain-containing protein [Pseudomonadota bacterium]